MEGEVVDAAGAPVAGAAIDHYAIQFYAQTPSGIRRFDRVFTSANPDLDPIVSDAEGRFVIEQRSERFTYIDSAEEYVCETICAAWEEVCDVYTSEYCDICGETECWDECWDDTYCDEYGDCWVETYCEPVCEYYEYECGCWIEEEYDCWDECSATEDRCAWETVTFEAHAAFEDVVETASEIRLREGQRAEAEVVDQWIEYCPAESEECNFSARWQQRDRFVLP